MPSKTQTPKDRDRRRAQRREWYRKNVEHERLRIAERKRELRAWFEEYKSNLSCQRCGENNIVTLDFHHRRSAEREISVTKAVQSGWSIKRILQEIEKCDVLCANCHRKLHRLQGY